MCVCLRLFATCASLLDSNGGSRLISFVQDKKQQHIMDTRVGINLVDAYLVVAGVFRVF